MSRRSSTKHPGPLPSPDGADDARPDAGAQGVRAQRLPWLADWLMRAPARWLGEGSTLSQDLAGAPHGLTYLRHLARGNRITRRASFEAIDAKNPPVLLIHGFLGTRGSMYPLERRMAAAGLTVFSFNLGAFNARDIRASAFLIHRKIESILAQTSVKSIDIVGHSMGGLIGLYYVKKLGGHARVRRLIMMGTPVKGTWWGLAGVLTLGLWSKSSWQLLPRSQFIDELNQGPLPREVDIYTLAAVRDAVCPLHTTRLRGATSVTVPMGHSSLVISEDVFSRILTILRGPDREGRAAADAAEAGRPDREAPVAPSTRAATVGRERRRGRLRKPLRGARR